MADSPALWLTLWILVVLGIVLVHRRRGGVGLVPAYLLNLSIIHFLGAAVYLSSLPHLYERETVIAGFRESFWGLLAFGIGSLVVAPVVFRDSGPPVSASVDGHRSLPLIYVLCGVLSFIALSSFLGDLPTLNAVVAVGQQMFVAGLCLLCWRAWKEQQLKKLYLILLLSFLLPFLTIVTQGFLSYGTGALVVILLFTASFVPSKKILLVVGIIFGYVGLSFFVSYSQERDDIREVVWGGQRLSERIERVYSATIKIEWFSPTDPDHLDAIDNRLNQNSLVGASIDYLDANRSYAYGATVGQSLAALVPRAVWPNKPESAGSGELVATYTGIEFDEGTSVGIGHVLESYVNFGTAGVVVAFLLLGTALTLIDVAARRKLEEGNNQGFVLLFLVGLSCLQVGGSLAELTTTMGASIAVVLFMNFLLYRFHRSSPHPRPSTDSPTVQGVSESA